MGININAGFAELITRFHSYKSFEGKSCLMLGVQGVSKKGIDIIRTAKSVDFELNPNLEITNKDRFRSIDSYTLFKWIGYSKVIAMDVSDYEGADIIQNLNEPIGEDLFERFDLIYDGGTLEHVFDTKQAMDNLVKMLKVGGVIIHDLPAANMCNHGFYSFSPTVFVDFYKSNGFWIDTIHLFNRWQNTDEDIQYNSVDCRLHDPLKFLVSKLDIKKECSFLVCMATKKEKYTEINTPIQGMYLDIYNNTSILFEDALEYTSDYLKKRGYKKIGIYGMGLNARMLYDIVEKSNGIDRICLIKGEGDDKKHIDEKYHLLEHIEQINDIECVIIGSLKFADEIEDRLRKQLQKKEIDIINLLDI